MSGPAERDDVPVSVRLGEVVPPDDPEDWTRPLTWVAALGMLAAPLLAVAWFGIWPPVEGQPSLGTFTLAAAAAGGGVLTGATQRGRLRAATATVGAALFAALALVALGAGMAGERQVGIASPPLTHAFAAAAAGLVGALAASPLMAVFALAPARRRLMPAAAAVAIGVALLVVPFVL